MIKKQIHKKKKIIDLTNSYCYRAQAFIVLEERNYRLVVIKSKEKIIDQSLDTLTEAKNAFNQNFDDYMEIGTEPEWGRPRTPDQEWLESNLKRECKKEDRYGENGAVDKLLKKEFIVLSIITFTSGAVVSFLLYNALF